MTALTRAGPLEALRLPPQDGTPRPALAVLHGAARSARFMARACAGLADRFDVWCLQGPHRAGDGFGYFPWDPGEPYPGPEVIAAAVPPVVAALGELPSPLAVLGHSQGGLIGSAAALSLPGRVCSVAVIKNSFGDGLVSPELVEESVAAGLALLVVVADGDPIVPASVGHEAVERARRAGFTARVVEVGGGHRLAVEEVELAGAFLAEAAAVG